MELLLISADSSLMRGMGDQPLWRTIGSFGEMNTLSQRFFVLLRYNPGSRKVDAVSVPWWDAQIRTHHPNTSGPLSPSRPWALCVLGSSSFLLHRGNVFTAASLTPLQQRDFSKWISKKNPVPHKRKTNSTSFWKPHETQKVYLSAEWSVLLWF